MPTKQTAAQTTFYHQFEAAPLMTTGTGSGGKPNTVSDLVASISLQLRFAIKWIKHRHIKGCGDLQGPRGMCRKSAVKRFRRIGSCILQSNQNLKPVFIVRFLYLSFL
jgi:hypothetical protein